MKVSKTPQLILAFVIPVIIASACHKSSSALVAPASLNIINAVATSQRIIPVLGTTDTILYYASALSIGYGSSALYSPLSGANTLYIVQKTDTTDPKLRLYNGSLNLTAGSIYSFFLAGDTTKPDTLFVQDNIPYYTDSSAGVRIVNLSPGSQPISVNIQGNPPTQTEFSNLAYKSISSFNKYAAGSAVPGSMYTFEIRNQANDSLLTTYTWYYTLYESNTLVISGSEDPASSTPLQVFQTNNY